MTYQPGLTSSPSNFLCWLSPFLVRPGRVEDVDPVQLAKCLDIASVVPEENDLMESQNVTAVLDIVHLDLNACPAPTSGGRIDISDHRACVEI